MQSEKARCEKESQQMPNQLQRIGAVWQIDFSLSSLEPARVMIMMMSGPNTRAKPSVKT